MPPCHLRHGRTHCAGLRIYADVVAIHRRSAGEERTQPLTWSSLAPKQKREIARYAKRNQGHPDPVLADIAERWAREDREPRPGLARLSAVLPAAIFAILGDVTAFNQFLLEPRLAKRLRAIGADQREE